MTTTLSALPDSGPVEKENQPLIAHVTAMQVTSKDEHGSALEVYRAIALREKAVKAFFADFKEKAHQAHKAICDKETAVLAPLAQAKAIASQKINTYTAAEEKRKREEEVRLQEQARKDAEERQIADAEQAQKDGRAEEAESILNQETEVPIVKVQTKTAKIAGVGTQKRWSAEVTDRAALIKWVAAHPENAELLEPNMPALNKLAIALKAGFNIPGCKAVETSGLSVRG